MVLSKGYFDKEVENKFLSVINRRYYDESMLTDCDEVNNAYILPTKRHFDENGNIYYKGGVVDSNKKFLINSKFIRNGLSGAVVDGYNFDSNDIINKDVEVLYAGVLINHFGHFLVEGTSRLWYWVENIEKNLDIAFLMPKNQKIFPQFWEFMDLLGINRNKVHIIKNITKFKKIYVPCQSHIIGKSYNNKFLVPFNYISSLLPEYTKENIYLSRRKFNNGPVLLGEKHIEKIFVDNGYRVIYPERLSLKQQITTIKNAKKIAGISGTAMHMALFMDKGIEITILERSDNPVEEQLIINEAIDAEAFYVGANVNPFPIDHSDGPILLAVTDNVIKYCKEQNYKINIMQANKVSNSDCKKFIKKYLQNYTQNDLNKYLSHSDSLLARRILFMKNAFIPLNKFIKQKIKSWRKQK